MTSSVSRHFSQLVLRRYGHGPSPLAQPLPKRLEKSIRISRKASFEQKSLSFDDFVRLGGEQAARDAGKWRLEEKDYLVKDGDVIHFRFNV